MRPIACILLLIALLIPAVPTAQKQVRGQVVNRDGAALQCQVDFYYGNNLAQRVHTDGGGYFYLTSPSHGRYRVVILYRGRQHELQVTIDNQGLHPPTFVVPW
jgi:hypothetical protein